MTPKNFLYLAVAAALSVLFAVVSYASNNQWSTGKAAGEKLFPSLSNDLSKVSGIQVRQGDESLTLEKAGATWGVKDRSGYPVDFAKIRTILVGLSEAELLEGKTRRSDRYAALELEDPAAKGTKSQLVRLIGDKGAVLAEVVLGKKKFEVFGGSKSGTYVRKPGDPQTWLTNTELNASISTKEWMRTNILTLDAAKISRVAIEIPGEQPLAIAREGGGAGRQACFRRLPARGQEVSRRHRRPKQSREPLHLSTWRMFASAMQPRRPVLSPWSRSRVRISPPSLSTCARTERRIGSRSLQRARARPRQRPRNSPRARRAGSTRSPTSRRTQS